MARARNIKPGFFKNEDLVELPFEYRLLFAGLWTLADRDGRLEDRPKRIKMEIFPADNVDIEDGLRELARYGLVKRYEVHGIKVVAIPKFLDHQHPHRNEAESVLPSEDGSVSGHAPEQDVPRSVQAPALARSTPAESLLSESLLSDSLNHPTGTSPVGECAQARATPATDPPVDNFPKPQGLATVQGSTPEFPDSSTAPEPAEPEKILSGFGTFPDSEPEKPAATAEPDNPRRDDRAKPTPKFGHGSRLPGDWQLPKSWGAWALGERPDLTEADVRREAACFADYWRAKAGKDARKADWEATWRNWIRKGEEFSRRQNRILPAARASPPTSAQPETADSWIRPESLQAREQARKALFGEVIDATG